MIDQGCIPIPGTKRVERLEENFWARTVEFDEEDLEEIRRVITECAQKGDRWVIRFEGSMVCYADDDGRYDAEQMKKIGH